MHRDINLLKSKSEVISFNKQLRKRMIQYSNVKILETDLERKYFTKHGLHLNSSGKETIALRLTTVVKSFFLIERMSPIYLYWKDDTVITNQDRRSKDSLVTNNNEKITPRLQPSHSPKETSENGKTTDSGPNIEEGRNGPNHENEISKGTAGSNKQGATTDVSNSMTNTSSKESGSDSKGNEPQYRTSKRPKKILIQELVIFYGHNASKC